MRGVDICDLYRRPRLARHFHDLIPCRDPSLDLGLCCSQPQEPHCSQVPKSPRWQLFRNSCAVDILLHSTQGTSCCRRYVISLYCQFLVNMFLAYTIYAFFEWALVLLDVGFDAVTMIEFQHLEIVVKDVRGVSRLYVPRLPI